MRLCLLLAAAALAGCATTPQEDVSMTTSSETTVHDIVKNEVPLASEEGQRLLAGAVKADYEPLEAKWEPQLRSHCGACSIVVAQNSLQDDVTYTQDGLFTPQTAHIITQDVVYDIGFTLEELHDMVEANSGMQAEWFRAGTDENQHGYEEFLAEVKRNVADPSDRLIINFSIHSLQGRGMGAGHFSPIAAYNEAEDMVLVLEINGGREKFWASSHDVYHSVESIDPVCGLNRGWLVVRP